MKKILLIMALIIILAIVTACGNRRVGIDTYQTFRTAYVNLGGAWKELQVETWRDFEKGDEIQITTPDGHVYLTHYSNMVLVN